PEEVMGNEQVKTAYLGVGLDETDDAESEEVA
ncbi:MAG: ABC transporter ATP-binding protein, partial [Gammaproteobacteria bacterium]|nr:ABC transporter ATP-binding protein [Gammaproteobacteria bacterium]